MYRTDPCPHCGVIPDETPDPMGAVAKCVTESVHAALEHTLKSHRVGLLRYRPGAVFWYLPQSRWCRVVVSEALPYGVELPAIGIPIEYPDDHPEHGMVPIYAFPDELAAWDPDDPRLPEHTR